MAITSGVKIVEDNMATLHCWILIGGAGARKGSMVRALTGIGVGRSCQVALNNGQWLHFEQAVVSSINEVNPPDPTEWAQRLLGAAVGKRHNLLLSLQIKSPPAPGLDAEDYVEALSKNGAFIESIITLGTATPSWVPGCGAPYASIPGSSQPTACSAKLVREFWQWA